MEKTLKFESLTLKYNVDDHKWNLQLPKSETQIKTLKQFALITETNDFFVPLEITEKDDHFYFTFNIDSNKKLWGDIKQLPRNDKLRVLHNVAKLFTLEKTRLTFFLHPDNLVFDDNLMPQLIFRGIKHFVPPFEMKEDNLLRQYKCLILSLFNEKYNFDDLYNGLLETASEFTTDFQKNIIKIDNLADLRSFIENTFRQEQIKSENTMSLVPKKKFKLYKRLSISLVVITIILFIAIIYCLFIKVPYQNKLLAAHRAFLALDYASVISELQDENIEKLPNQAKYILAYSFIKVENLSDKEKETIMNNISLNSDPNYLIYWIYNGLGNFDESIDIAKYLDDPRLIIYGLIKKMEQVKNDPKLTGTERDELVENLRKELDKYIEEFELDSEEINLDSEESEIDSEENIQMENSKSNNQSSNEKNSNQNKNTNN